MYVRLNSDYLAIDTSYKIWDEIKHPLTNPDMSNLKANFKKVVKDYEAQFLNDLYQMKADN